MTQKTFENYLEGQCWPPYYARFLGHKHNPKMGIYQNDGDYDRLTVGEVYRIKGSPQTLFDCVSVAIDIDPLAVVNYYGTHFTEEWERVAVENTEETK